MSEKGLCLAAVQITQSKEWTKRSGRKMTAVKRMTGIYLPFCGEASRILKED